ADIARIQELWTDCRQRYGKAGSFLFGAFTGADAMYAPVIHRFRTYAIDVTSPVRAYMDTMISLPAFQQWTDEALAETIVIEKFEAD
ncbi:MAG: glutathione S-transferase C-terminal domain-containing protein, partial [Nitrobacter sp.]